MILDVGCGCRPTGNVNIDIYKRDSPESHSPYNGKNISNFVQASGCYLPFQNETFDLVKSNHSLEHTPQYVKFFKEMIRVSKNAVFITVPHRFNHRSRHGRFHHQLFNKKWFFNTLHKWGLTNFRLFISKWQGYPHDVLPLIRVPTEVTVEIFKKSGLVEQGD